MELSGLTIPDRFAGPPFAANGGYTVGILAERLGVRGLHARLRAPVPLSTPVEVVVDATEASISHHGRTLMIGTPVSLLDRTAPRVDFVTAAVAAGNTDRASHPFPDCFVCGPNRTAADGMHLFPGEVAPGLVAVSWRPSLWQADPTGMVPLRLVTAALDCPSIFPFAEPGGRALLASMTLEVFRLPHVSEHLVVTGWARGRDGRKMHGAAAVSTADGEVVARSNTLWVAVTVEELQRIEDEVQRSAA